MLDILKKILLPKKMDTILVVDDSEVDRNLAAGILKKRYKVLTATNGKEGLELAKSSAPDVIVLDCMMPDMNGPEVCDVLKEDGRTRDIPVIFLTSINTPENVLNCFSKGGENFLTKPIKADELVKHVKMSLEGLSGAGKGEAC